MPARPLRIPDDLWLSMNDEPEVGVNLIQKGFQKVGLEAGLREKHYQRTYAVRFLARVLGKLGLVRPIVRQPARGGVAGERLGEPRALLWAHPLSRGHPLDLRLLGARL